MQPMTEPKNPLDQGDALRGEGYERVGGWAEITENGGVLVDERHGEAFPSERVIVIWNRV
jgi:hypothetical protein